MIHSIQNYQDISEMLNIFIFELNIIRIFDVISHRECPQVTRDDAHNPAHEWKNNENHYLCFLLFVQLNFFQVPCL